jgi:nucleotide-binding universal stress UspA family protein
MATEQKTKSAPVKVRNILVPVDFSENSAEAIKYASSLALQFGARLTLMHVVEPPTFMSNLQNVPYTLSDKQLEMTAQTELESLAVRYVETQIQSKPIVRKGKSYDEIVKVAKQLKADWIVISTHGHAGLTHTLLGSTAERVVRHAHCPVLVIR